MSNVLKATIIENKTTSVTTRFKELTTGNNAFIVSVIKYKNVTSCRFYIKRSIVSALGLRSQAGDATDQCMGRSMKRCDTLEVWWDLE